jgi:hypothetical protein
MTCRILALLALAATTAAGQDSTTVQFSGFVDGYYGFDFQRPRARDRAYTTQSARHNEFNVNLAYVDAVLAGPRLRGRVAVQFGTSVQANYAGEPRVGTYSGPEVARYIQEAVVGVRIAPALWIDGGIHLSHIGSESWISRDNLAYTRSLIADYSPYYQSGIRLTWQASSSLVLQLNAVNGWQVISETNDDKSFGGRVDWTVNPKATVSLYNLLGNEMPDSAPSRLRLFQGASLRLVPSERLTVVGTFDVGSQDHGDDRATWYGAALVARTRVRTNVWLVGRVERYDDPDQVIVVTDAGDAFRATGSSIGLDLRAANRLLWRSEFRGLRGTRAVFPERDGTARSNVFLVTSLALTF